MVKSRKSKTISLIIPIIHTMAKAVGEEKVEVGTNLALNIRRVAKEQQVDPLHLLEVRPCINP